MRNEHPSFEMRAWVEEVEERNRLRAEAGLPLLSVATEVRRRYENKLADDFEQFMLKSPIRKRIEAKLLARCRRLRGDPDWRPTGFLSGGGYWFYVQVRKTMTFLWRRRRMALRNTR